MPESSSDHSRSVEKTDHALHSTVSEAQIDTAAQLTAGTNVQLDPEVARKLRWKIDLHLMPLMGLMYLMTFADKTTLGQSAVLGIMQVPAIQTLIRLTPYPRKGAHLNQNQFNWLGAVFYLSYLAFEYPQNLALQRFPVGKWMSINIFIWAIALLAHAACKSFGALFAVRFILGACEGAITPAFMIVTSMFYTREEQTLRVGYWFLMNGFAIIFLGFTSFGVLHTKTPTFMPWQWLMVITGLITLVTAVIFWFFFPDSPTNARFLTPEERVLAVQRIKINQTGVENKHWKRDQFIETVKDPKVWIMFFFAAVSNIVNSLVNQRQLIINQFGFSPIKTTLLGCVDGVVEIVTIWFGVVLASHKKVGRGYAGVIMYAPAILGAILVNTLPFNNKVGLLFSYWLTIFAITPFVIFLGWVSSLTSGHTKRISTNAIVLIGYAIGNFASPFAWEKKYQPRNRVPWALLTVSMFVSALLLLFLRWVLAAENKRRDALPRDETYDDVYLTQINPDGTTDERKVDRAFLDLTDIQNQEFRYLL